VKRALGPSDRLYPMPSPLVVAGTLESADTLAVAWIGIASATPPSVAMALRGTRHTLEHIRKQGDFTVNVPSTSLAPLVDYCGLVSGRDHDKFAETGLTLAASSAVTSPMIEECPYNMECRVTHEIEIGQYVLVIGEVVETHAEEAILDESGTRVDIEALDPLVYIAGLREYRALGRRVADAFSVGKTVVPKE